MTFELLIVADGSLLGAFCLVPSLVLGKAIELVADATARVMIEVREAVEVGREDGRHA